MRTSIRGFDAGVAHAVAEYAMDCFRADWENTHPDSQVEYLDEILSRDRMMLTIRVRIDVYERELNLIMYSDMYTCAEHIYGELWKEGIALGV